MGYLNRNNGAIGSKAAIMTVINRRVLTGTERMLRSIPPAGAAFSILGEV
jgi:hypothetical protein